MKNLNSQLHLFVFFLLFAINQKAYAQTWIPQNSNESNPVVAIEAIDENVAWACGWEGSVVRTVDGGQNWVSITVPGTQNYDFFSIAAINADTAYFSGAAFNASDARIYRTTDGGANWEMQYQNTQSDAYFNSIAFWDESNGIAVSDAVGGSFLIVTTSDGGENWEQVPSGNIPAPLNGEFAGVGYPGGTSLVVENTGMAWFGTAYGNTTGQPVRIFKSMDCGQNWIAVETPFSTALEFSGITTMAFEDAMNGYAGGYNGGLMKTTDGGQTWIVDTSFIHPDVVAFEYVPGTNHQVIVTASPDGTVYSNDGGASWMSMGNDEFFNLSFVNDSTGWAAAGWEQGVGGLISKFQGELITSVEENFSNIENDLHSTSYPNPFNSKTAIDFYLSNKQHVKLQIFNSNGKIIETLVNENKPPGNYKVIFDASKLSSGVYHYRLQVGNITEFKKLVLIR